MQGIPDPSFPNMYISKSDPIGYRYTYTYHANALLLVMHIYIHVYIDIQLPDMTPCIFSCYACAYLGFSTYPANTGSYLGHP
jgi:hypothetical protein